MKFNVLIFAISALAFCIAQSFVGIARAEDGKVGGLFELSGPMAPNGESCRRGVEIAAASARREGKSTPQLVIGDYRGEAKTAISEFQRITSDPVVFAVINTRSLAAMAINPLSKRSQIPIFSTAGHPRLLTENDFSFRIYPSVQVEGRVLSQGLIDDGRKRIGIVTLEDDWTVALEDAVVSSLVAAGNPPPELKDRILPGEVDFSPIVAKIKRLNLDAMVINLAIGETGTFVRRLREQLPNLPIYTNFWGVYPEVVTVAGAENMRGAKYVAVNLEKPKFRQSFSAIYPNAEPSAVTYCCYAGMRLLLESYAATGTFLSREQFWNKAVSQTRLELPDEILAVKDREILFDVRMFEYGSAEPKSK